MGELPVLKQLYADLNIQIFNMKKLLALLLLFGIVGCAINTPLIIDVRDSGQTYDEMKANRLAVSTD